MKTFPLDTILHEYNFVPLGGPAYWDWNQHRVRGEYWRLYWNDAPAPSSARKEARRRNCSRTG